MPVKFWHMSLRFWFFLSYLITTVRQTFLVNLTSLTKSINWLRQEERNGETQPEIDRKIDIQKPCAAATTTDIEVSCTVYNGVKIFNKLHSNFEKTNIFRDIIRNLKLPNGTLGTGSPLLTRFSNNTVF